MRPFFLDRLTSKGTKEDFVVYQNQQVFQEKCGKAHVRTVNQSHGGKDDFWKEQADGHEWLKELSNQSGGQGQSLPIPVMVSSFRYSYGNWLVS